MCGIASVISSEPARRALVHDMVDRQRHRGPDHDAVWSEGLCAMGHNRLSLVDLSAAGDQPMTWGQYTITFNGEIYNHMELREKHLPSRVFKGTSDTETLLRLIERYGVSGTLPLLRGMWAFALWDAHRETLTMAVDPFGIKPLYVWHKGTEFACASSSAALLCMQSKWHISREGMARFFLLGGTTGAFHGIRRLEGGHMVVVDKDSFHDQRWYTPTFNPNAEHDLPQLLDEALDLVQHADVGVGLFLSGGVDSSLAASACSIRRPAFHLDSAEREHAQVVADRFGMPLHVVSGDPDRIIEAYTDIARKCGEPTMGGHIPWMVSEYAGDHCKAAISANGADELFFGYTRTARTVPEWKGMVRHIQRNPASFELDSQPEPWDVEALGNNAFPYDAHSRWFELMMYVQHDLLHTLDAASMCHSLEMRVPYLDHKLVEAALSLPASYHGDKRVLRERLEQLGIPKATIHRQKLGFSLSRNSDALKAEIARAVKYMQRTHGFRVLPGATGRDRQYLELCCLAWKVWEDVHRDKLKDLVPR